jgi:hypothetical protein
MNATEWQADGMMADDSNAIRASVSRDGSLRASFVMSAYPMKWSDHWRLSYRENRYCRHLTQAELNRRVRDIFLNFLRLTPDAKVGLPPMSAAGIKWMVLWTHVLEEMRLRHGPYPNGFTREILHREPYPDFAGELAQKAASVLVSRGVSSGNVLIKYGKPEWMASLYEHGRFRVQSAGYYSKPDHNGAVRDDELSLQVSLALNRCDIVNVVTNPQDVPAEAPDQRFDVDFRHPTDYWMYCLTSSVEPRHFVDFDCTACVVIRDRSEFIRRLQAVQDKYFPGTVRRHGLATYIDPLQPSTARIDLPMSKHFRFAYQDEYRFVWEPVKRTREVTHVDVALGSLRDISELVTL